MNGLTSSFVYAFACLFIGTTVLSCGDSTLAFDPDQRGIPPEYHPPPAPCARASTAFPILAMPWRGRAQTFLEAGSEVDAVEIDYDVWPRPHVDRVFIGLDFDPLADIDAISIDEECPEAIQLSPLRTAAMDSTAAPGDVVRAVILAEDDDRSRRGELFFTTGEQTAFVEFAAEPSRDGPSLLLFEPAWGEPRVALAVIEEDDAMPWAIRGLPEGPGTLAWVDPSGEILHDVGAGAVYLPGGFAQDWTAFASRFVALPVMDVGDASEGTPAVLRHGAADYEDAVLRAGLEWDGMRPMVLLASDDGARLLPMDAPPPSETPRQGDVRVACNASIRIHSPSFARVFVTTSSESTAQEIPFAEALIVSTECEEGGEFGQLGLGVASRNRRDVRIVLEMLDEESGS